MTRNKTLVSATQTIVTSNNHHVKQSSRQIQKLNYLKYLQFENVSLKTNTEKIVLIGHQQVLKIV